MWSYFENYWMASADLAYYCAENGGQDQAALLTRILSRQLWQFFHGGPVLCF